MMKIRRIPKNAFGAACVPDMHELIIMKPICLAAALITLACSLDSAHAESADVYLFAGQSNIQVVATTSLQNAPANIKQDPGVKIWDVQSNRFQTYQIGVNSLQPAQWPQNSGLPGNWGPEAEFSYLMRKAHPDTPIYVIKYGIGGTQLAKDLEQIDWSPSSDRNEYFGLVESAVDAAKTQLKNEGKDPIVRAVVWMQGENDASTDQTANAYEANLREWAAAARKRWGDPESKLIIGRIFMSWGSAANYKTVRASQLAVVQSTPNSFLITRDPKNLGHFLPDQVTDFGRDIFDAYSGIESPWVVPGACERRPMLAPLAPHPHPWRRTLQVTKRRPRTWRRSVLRPRLPIGQISRGQVMGFAAHTASQIAA